MAKHGKRYLEAAKLVDPEKQYAPLEAAALVKKTANTKFDQTVEVHIRLGVDPRQSEEAVRGTVGLPHGTGKRVRIAVFAQGEKALEATKAGADEVGAADLVAKVDGGWLDFDVAIATPDMMGQVGKLGKVLGPQGKMPSPKAGTVTPNVAAAVREFKAGKIEFRTDAGANVHAAIGRKSFQAEDLAANLTAFLDHLRTLRPSQAKGEFIKKVVVSASMGPGVALAVQ
jgi:large subunit ribosomal protein L1